MIVVSSTPAPQGPELIFSIVRPLGIDRDAFVDALRNYLVDYSYNLEHIKISDLIGKFLPAGKLTSDTPEHERIKMLIEAGDRECEQRQSAAALACYAIAEIRFRRQCITKDATVALPRTVYLIDSIKRTDEADLLRGVYGDRYVQFGLKSDTDKRERALADKLATVHFSKTKDEISSIVSGLMERDQREEGDYGQKVSKAFPLSDVFIDCDKEVGEQINRFLRLLFGDPDYKPPTTMEFGMNLAYVSSTRSTELGLKVGAAILDDVGRIISLGYNHHPINPEQAPTHDASSAEINSLVLDTLRALEESHLNRQAQKHLGENPEKFVRELLGDALSSARIRDLIEFQLTVHAEMSALVNALERGGVHAGHTLYVTAYPCHGCAKHIVAAGMKVVYLEPYPKSRAAAMYGEGVSDFAPFIGIAPSRYDTLFRVFDERKTRTGYRVSWGSETRASVLPKVSALTDQGEVAKREGAALSVLGTENE